MVTISKGQLLILIILYEIGTTTLFAIGIDAKQDAWIAILIAMLAGFGLLWVYTRIQQAYPDQHLGMILLNVCGKWIGSVFALLYAVYFLYFAATNFWEFGQITILLLLDKTPQAAILLTTLFVMCFAVFLGLEVIARAGQLLIPYFLGFLSLIICLAMISGNVQLDRLQPVLENGIVSVVRTAFPNIVSFPFGESVVFLLYWKHVREKNDIFKTSIIGMGISGILLMTMVIMMLLVLGPTAASLGTVPLRRMAMHLSIGDFFQNFDALAFLAFFIGGFFKMTLNFYAGILLVQSILRIQKPTWIIVSAGACIFWFSITFFSSLMFQRWIGFHLNTTYIHPIFQIMLPVPLLLIMFLQKKWKQRTVH